MHDNGAHSDLPVDFRDGIAFVTVNRPQARNAFTLPMYGQLAATCARINDDPAIEAMILTGAGDKAFSSGTDIAHFRGFNSPDDALAYENFMEGVFQALETCRVPIVAAIAGACTGGGAAIAACCDLRLATADAKFGVPIARTLGNCLSVANLGRFAALIGPARVKELIFTARLVAAEEALRIGLVSEVLPDRAALDARAAALARQLATHAPLTMRSTKEGLRRLRQVPLQDNSDLILMCYTSRDFREGMDAFLEKRAPEWHGE